MRCEGNQMRNFISSCFSDAEFDINEDVGCIPSMGMYLKAYKRVDHCPTYDKFSSAFYF